MRCFLLLLLLLPGGGSLWAQAPVVVQSQRRLGHRINSEQARAIVYTRHRRLAVAGTYQYPNAQGQWVNAPSALWLLNKQGDSLTSVLYSYIRPDGFMGNYGLWAVAEAANGDLLMLGNKTVSLGPNGTTANVLLRTDSLGVLRWVRTYPGSSYAPTAIQPLPDNGALLVTNNQHPLGTGSFPVSVPTLLRVDSLGALVWQRSYGQPYNTLQSIVPLADGSYALAGNKSTGPPQWLIGGWVLRVNNSGDTLRSRVLGGPQTQFYAVAAAPGGGLVLGGTPGITNRANALVMVTDSLDQVTWQQNVFSPTANFSPSLTFVRALQRPGQVLVGGNRPVPAPYPGTNNYLAVWQAPTAPGATPSLVWEQQFPELFLTHPSTVLTPTEPGSMVGVGQYAPRVSDLRITRFANVPALYQVPLPTAPGGLLCRRRHGHGRAGAGGQHRWPAPRPAAGVPLGLGRRQHQQRPRAGGAHLRRAAAAGHGRYAHGYE